MQYLVIGANGYIGSYIYHQFIEDGIKVLGTSRRQPVSDGLIFYDIQEDIDQVLDQMSGTEKAAVICIAEANIDKCYENYESAYRINVLETKRLIHKLIERGLQVVFFSSDNVFDGLTGNYTEESQVNPVNSYGRMKAEMEQYLLEKAPETCILRIPKVVSPFRARTNILTEWENHAVDGKINCIRGNRLSFVSIDDIYHACRLVTDKKMTGLYNIAGDVTYSRAELAEKFYAKAGINHISICECDVNSFGFKDNRALNVGLNNHKFKQLTQYQFTGMECVIEQYLKNNAPV